MIGEPISTIFCLLPGRIQIPVREKSCQLLGRMYLLDTGGNPSWGRCRDGSWKTNPSGCRLQGWVMGGPHPWVEQSLDAPRNAHDTSPLESHRDTMHNVLLCETAPGPGCKPWTDSDSSQGRSTQHTQCETGLQAANPGHVTTSIDLHSDATHFASSVNHALPAPSR